jgi:hypothetical protein
MDIPNPLRSVQPQAPLLDDTLSDPAMPWDRLVGAVFSVVLCDQCQLTVSEYIYYA